MPALDSEYVEATLTRYQQLKAEEAELVQRLGEVRSTLPVLEQTLVHAGVLPNWPKMQRPQMIRQAILDAGHPLSPVEIRAVFAAHGRPEGSVNNITATLTQMQTQGKVASAGGSKWDLTDKGREGG